MRSFNVKDILVIVIIISLMFYIYMDNDYSVKNNKTLNNLRMQRDSLMNVNKFLILDIIILKDSIEQNQLQIDSLKNERNKIVTKYKTKINEIDKFNSVELVNEFDSIFSSANIK